MNNTCTSTILFQISSWATKEAHIGFEVALLLRPLYKILIDSDWLNSDSEWLIDWLNKHLPPAYRRKLLENRQR